MLSDYCDILKKKICPGCGAEVLIRFCFNEMMMEAPCPTCGVMVKWKRKWPGSGGLIRTAFEDDTPELVQE